MERMSIVQIFIVFVLASATGSSLQPSVAPRNDCGHGRIQCGRGGLCYSPPHEGCCEGQGGHAIFDTRESICCGGNLAPKRDGINVCCGERVIDRTQEICCAETNHSRFHWSNNRIGIPVLETYQECCGAEPFDDRKHVCCDAEHPFLTAQRRKEKLPGRINSECCDYRNGTVKLINIAHETCPAFGRCGGVIYNLDENICCNDRLLSYTGNLTRATAACCNGSLYDVTLQSCCFHSYTVRLGRPTETCCASSISGKIDSSTHLCCASSPLMYTSASQRCCRDTLYDSNNNKCCGGTIISKGATCCNHQWVLKANEVCCLKGAPVNVSNSHQKCCEGVDDSGRRQAQAYNPRTQSCIEGNVSTKQPCIGGPGKICCQGVQHDSRGGEVQCCAPGINTYFTRNQTCCDGNIFSGSNLTCCGGGSVCNQTDTCPDTFNRNCGRGCLTNGRTICCGGQVYPFRMGPNRPKCCGRYTYNESTQNCVNGQVVKVKFCPEDKCGGKLPKGVAGWCRSTNDSVLVFEGVAKKLKRQSKVTFRKVFRLDSCGRSTPEETVYPEKIVYETKCRCNLKDGKEYVIIVRNYQENQLKNQAYRLGMQDLVLEYSADTLTQFLKQKNRLRSKSRPKSV